MSKPESLPRRQAHTTNDDIRQASLADAPADFDGFPAVDWVRDTGASVSDTLMKWENGRLAELPVGRAWDVIRLPHPEAWEVVRHLRAIETPVGPVLHYLTYVDFLVPVGSAENFDLPGADVLREGELLLAPHPAVVAPHTQDAMSWLFAPRAESILTDPADLYGAYAAAIAVMDARGGK
ncbi:hypothetical protein ACFXKX_23720 [Streptomyces scopuliridis]|uniref:hypothetical protein n=1 Tax=Streptomyces scopuliridis TaxID=452529 RepID=UPI0036C97781